MPRLTLEAVLGLNKTGFDAGISSAEKQVRKFGEGMKSTLSNFLTTGAIISFVKNLIDSTSRLNDLSSKIGVNSEALQQFAYAAKQTGANIEDVATAFRFLSKARAEALQNPNGEHGQVFGAMGIDAAELRAKNLETLFRKIAETVRTTDFGASEMAMVEKILGRGAGELIPMFKQGLEDLATEARKVGAVMNDDIVMAIDDIGDSIQSLTDALKTTLAPAVKFVADQLTNVYDFMDAAVGNVGAIIGTIAGGGTIQEARDAGREHIFSIMERREQREQQREQRLQRRREGKPEQPELDRIKKDFEFTPTQTESVKKAATTASITASRLGQIGAFTGAGALQNSGQMQMVERLSRIHDALIRQGIIVRDAR